MGKGRTTTGMVICCLIKDIVHSGNHNKEFAFKQVSLTRKFGSIDGLVITTTILEKGGINLVLLITY